MTKENIVKNAELPATHKTFNWGAFFLTWIWGIGNKSYKALWSIPISFLANIPFLVLAPIAFAVWLGINGNELAWKNRQWENIHEFEEVQKRWALWGVILMSIFVTITAIFYGIALSEY